MAMHPSVKILCFIVVARIFTMYGPIPCGLMTLRAFTTLCGIYETNGVRSHLPFSKTPLYVP
jgi:hypothetical protein